MLVMRQYDLNLREYLQKNHNQITWKERIRIAYKIALKLFLIDEEKVITFTM